MIADIFNIALYQPIYNGLVFLISVLPFGDVGLAVVVLTIVVKFIIFPFTHKSVKAQRRMKEIEPEVKKVKEEFKNDKQQQSKKVMELYQKHGVSPFSGCLLLLIQIPVIFALYWVFWKGLTNGLDESTLYTFVAMPEKINMHFLGLIDISGKSLILAFLAGVTQYFQIRLSFPFAKGSSDSEKDPGKSGVPSFKDEFAKSFRLQMKYGFPLVVFFIAYTISAAVALYWATSNIFSILHELWVRHQAKKITSSSVAQ